ncbi:hypothetical protein K431DRAFT_285211 [Polychaeton citri CBS 116435]|uniref:DUF1330 domain-containing protein n=1 Tax=Polychaeton citri CBS 116435 TaxID=1314669 RepID=A0A9P4UNQ7_9PEZI|nr:hypothetical protein K431DRAFT_285211 [Polychaeton citri CBS 116435]
MPLTTVHLLKLSSNATISQYLRILCSGDIKPLIVARAVRWIIKPEKLSRHRLLRVEWDLMLIMTIATPLPKTCLSASWVTDHWSITAGIPSRLLTGFEERNRRLLSPQAGDVPPLTGALEKPLLADNSQGLELSSDLRDWANGFKLGQDGAVSMLNLLAFLPTDAAHESYMRYGAAFAESIGSRRGGNAKLVGKVVSNQGTDNEDEGGWDEIALAHYPSINHFIDMLASEDYQEVNHRDRLPALKDTCILCTSELSPDLNIGKARL